MCPTAGDSNSSDSVDLSWHTGALIRTGAETFHATPWKPHIDTRPAAISSVRLRPRSLGLSRAPWGPVSAGGRSGASEHGFG
eukprot:6678649-Pyramimonas_sp.AAC.1